MATRKVDIEPISSLKRASAIAERVHESRRPLYITQNGRASLVIQDVESYERREQAVAFLKLCLQGVRDADEGRSRTTRQFRESLRRRVQRRIRALGLK